MQVGEEYRVPSDSAIRMEDKRPAKIRGVVIYVHPKGRFATLEFQGIHGKFRECYYPEQLTQRNRVSEKKRRRIRIVC